MIPFNVPPCVGTEEKYIKDAIAKHKICGDGEYTKKCNAWFEEKTGAAKVLLTTSCTHATEMAALLCDIKPGDEVIMPSFTFVSTADAFVLRGATVVFVDIRPDTMNIDETKIEAAITDKTVAIVPVHYAGVACEMDTIMDIAKRHNLKVVEDAAQGVMSTYHGKALGTIGDFGAYSFHETKNYSMGEGGALLINDDANVEMAEIIREKGTNRAKFFRGQIDKYTWVEAGSSYLPSELNAAYLYGQLEKAQEIFDDRMNSWNKYYDAFKELADAGKGLSFQLFQKDASTMPTCSTSSVRIWRSVQLLLATLKKTTSLWYSITSHFTPHQLERSTAALQARMYTQQRRASVWYVFLSTMVSQKRTKLKLLRRLLIFINRE